MAKCFVHGLNRSEIKQFSICNLFGIFFMIFFHHCDRFQTLCCFKGYWHRLNMELDLQSLFGLQCTVQLYSLAETPQLPHPPAVGLIYEGAISQPR